MAKQSAGILLFRKKEIVEVFLVHPGGPLYSRKDEGVWSVPKGEYAPPEDPHYAAIREFKEETGQDITGDFIALTPVKQRSGKVVNAWAVEGDLDPAVLTSNTFEMIWPPKSQRLQTFVEVDKGAWFTFEKARVKINPGQIPLLDELQRIIGERK